MKIMVSACLLGDNCKYNGGNNFHKELVNFLKDYEVIKICPEVMGGLSIPRIPAEIKNNKVINQKEVDVTKEYYRGAEKTLKIAQDNNIKIAILKKHSPSCGSGYVYDGTFSHTLTKGDGITAKLLKENGIMILNEDNYNKMNERN